EPLQCGAPRRRLAGRRGDRAPWRRDDGGGHRRRLWLRPRARAAWSRAFRDARAGSARGRAARRPLRAWAGHHDRAPARKGRGMRVLIADDHGVVRGGLRLLLDRQPDMEVVAEAADGAEAVAEALAARPDLAILDVAMPRLTGLQAAREIKAHAPDVNVLILSMLDDERYLFEALKAGASGWCATRSGAGSSSPEPGPPGRPRNPCATGVSDSDLAPDPAKGEAAAAGSPRDGGRLRRGRSPLMSTARARKRPPAFRRGG